jgi:sugar transferase (PEP-CTERM/EpsH1 system associated)
MAHAFVDSRPLVAHVVYRFDVGGLENGVVNLINQLPADRFRHVVISMTDITDFRRRVQREDVRFFAMNKLPGQGLRIAPRMWTLLRQLSPAIVHTRNIAALEMSLPAALARVPVRIHGEHGWDTSDPQGRSHKFRIMRRVYRPFVHRYIALSKQLERYLVDGIGVPADRIEQIYNGVDARRFSPPASGRLPISGSPFLASNLWLVGTVGRLQAIKDQVLLAKAFVRAVQLDADARASMRLVLVGDGALRSEVERVLREGGVTDLAWLAGSRDDIPSVLRGLDAFVLPSLAEGISNTILEAMATGLPIVATLVGGNGELLVNDATGRLVPASDVDAMASALLDDFRRPAVARARGASARAAVLTQFSLDAMVTAYGELYQRLIERNTTPNALKRA